MSPKSDPYYLQPHTPENDNSSIFKKEVSLARMLYLVNLLPAAAALFICFIFIWTIIAPIAIFPGLLAQFGYDRISNRDHLSVTTRQFWWIYSIVLNVVMAIITFNILLDHFNGDLKEVCITLGCLVYQLTFLALSVRGFRLAYQTEN